MFGFDDAILWPAVIGALSGGATSKDPLTGALTGGAMGAVSGGLLNAGGATALGGANPAVEASKGLLNAAPITPQFAPVIDKGVSAGLLDKLNFRTGNPFSPGGLIEKANDVAKPIGTAMNVANMFQQPPEEPMQITPSPFMQPQTGPQAGLQSVVAGNQQMDFMQHQKDALAEQKRKAQIAGIGRMY